MSAARKTTVGVIFGGRSVEHDVSVVTGHQVMRAFDPERYEVHPIYIDREGHWFTGEPLNDLKTFTNEVVSVAGVQPVTLSPSVQHHGLMHEGGRGRLFGGGKPTITRLDVVFPAVHGSHGEDGTLQGLLELADIPYVGGGVLASALANDKAMAKAVLRDAGVPVVPALLFTREQWLNEPEYVVSHIHSRFTYPVFVKPTTLGSSIGIARAADERLLRASIDVAFNFDRRVLIEQAVMGGIEINCALLGDERECVASILEQPVSWEEFLTYEEKYLRGGEGMKSAQRLIPAPIAPELTQRIRDMALQAFRAIDGRGTARLDFLVKPEADEVYLNEINTMPGSVAFYLWPEMSPRHIVDRLVALARDAHAEKRRSTYNYQTNLIALTSARGIKGMKGGRKS